MSHFSAGRRAVTFLGLVPMVAPTGRCGSKFWFENATLAKCGAGGPCWAAKSIFGLFLNMQAKKHHVLVSSGLFWPIERSALMG